MKRMMMIGTFLMAFTFVLTTGCTTETRVVEKAVPVPMEKEKPAPIVVKEQTVVVKEMPPAPPPLRVEYRGVAPSPSHVWLPGFWDWNGRDYVWISGEWAETPPSRSEWVPGHWEQTSGGWTWISGYWR